MNALERYLAETGDTTARLAERVGRAQTSITRPLQGKRNVSMNIALEIEKATGGAVTADEFMAICLAARRAQQSGKAA